MQAKNGATKFEYNTWNQLTLAVPVKKQSERNGCTTVTVHIWHQVGKAKTCLSNDSLLF